MERPASIWESAPPETSAPPSPTAGRRVTRSLTFQRAGSSRRRSCPAAHLAAHFGEKTPLRRCEALDPAGRDLVEHAVDFRLRRIAFGPARLGGGAGARRAGGVDQHARSEERRVGKGAGAGEWALHVKER